MTIPATVPAGAIVMTRLSRVIFGRPAAEAVAEEVARAGAGRVLLIASKTLAEQTDEVDRIRAALGGTCAGVHVGVGAHVPRPDVVAAAEAARAAGADLMVAVGGGSVIDCAKIVPVLLKHGVRDADAMDAYRIKVGPAGAEAPDYAAPEVPVICVPTTLSGGEFNPLSGATDPASGAKQGYRHPAMAPVSVVLDPWLGRHTPEWLWLSTGVRAADHAIETLASKLSNPWADGIADSALRLLARGLVRVKAAPEDWAARAEVQLGVWQSMMPLTGGVPMGASHAIGHVLGGLCGVAHGHTSCVMTPYVLGWNAADPEAAARQPRIAAALGAEGRPAAEAADAFVRALGMPRSLAEVGVGRDRFEAIAEHLGGDIWGRTNPRPITGIDDVREILESAAG